MTNEEYFEDSLRDLLDGEGITCLDEEQIITIARDMACAHENLLDAPSCYGGHEGSGDAGRIKELKRLLAEEKNKTMCPVCMGSGREQSSCGPVRTVSRSCDNCNGTGRL